jgi:geranylgeranyl diphosphate synthase type II
MGVRRLYLLAEPDLRRVKEAFSSLMPLDGCLDGRLRAVVADVLAHPGSLARAQLAYGLGVRRGIDPQRALKLAVAVEYFHSASLIFDDMPSMDDATERRGRPCPHVVHGEAAATLGALSLITRAYALLWDAVGSCPGAAALVGECLGVSGILDGQARDVHFRREAGLAEVAEIVEVEAAKTVPLVRLAMVLPAVVAGEDPETLDRLERLASAWGLAYQILDDFKDRLMSAEESGKTARRDDGLGRPSLPALAGPRRALARLRRLLAESRSIVDSLSAEEGDRWAPLESLQAFLEKEAREVPRRLEREAA